MWCASLDMLSLLHLQLIFLKNAAFLGHVTMEQSEKLWMWQNLVSLVTNLRAGTMDPDV